MSDEVPILTDTVEGATVTTTLYPDGTKWISTVRGGPHDSYASVMDRTGDIHALHQSVLDFLTAPPEPSTPEETPPS